MAAPSSSQPKFEVPEGWVMETKRNKKGQLVKSYANIKGQRFYSESDLMSYINYAKESRLSIYAPDFVPPTTGPFAKRSTAKVETASSSKRKRTTKSNVHVVGPASKHNQKEADEVVTEDEFLCASALLEFSGQRSDERRTSRRIYGRQPELQLDFDLKRPLESIIKNKRHKSQH
ncbi:hypothetical protein CASFOL_021612 [Castilleja foliolosa]|uniref:MBD domain-containing protein n=1 Tax=Castilleja foliolosa TaxID=1961234 RepID=A0ABD3CX19_9LAMI